MKKNMSLRIDDDIETKLDFIISSLKNENQELSKSEIIRLLIEEKFNQLAKGKTEPVVGEMLDDVNPDLLMVAEKINYIFEYMELLLKADSEIKKFYTDINGKYDSEKIKKYVKSESYYRDFVTAKINKETEKNGQ